MNNSVEGEPRGEAVEREGQREAIRELEHEALCGDDPADAFDL